MIAGESWPRAAAPAVAASSCTQPGWVPAAVHARPQMHPWVKSQKQIEAYEVCVSDLFGDATEFYRNQHDYS